MAVWCQLQVSWGTGYRRARCSTMTAGCMPGAWNSIPRHVVAQHGLLCPLHIQPDVTLAGGEMASGSVGRGDMGRGDMHAECARGRQRCWLHASWPHIRQGGTWPAVQQADHMHLKLQALFCIATTNPYQGITEHMLCCAYSPDKCVPPLCLGCYIPLRRRTHCVGCNRPAGCCLSATHSSRDEQLECHKQALVSSGSLGHLTSHSLP